MARKASWKPVVSQFEKEARQCVIVREKQVLRFAQDDNSW
jgi:hypothetical protein